MGHWLGLLMVAALFVRKVNHYAALGCAEAFATWLVELARACA